MKCPRCQQENPPQAKFCLECATPLVLRCASCATQLPAGAKFCFECATPVSAPGSPPGFASPEAYTPRHLAEKILTSRSALEGERKQVTVLFCDIAGSTTLAERVGPEVMHGLLNRFFDLAMAEVHRYEGTINQFLGDGFMALFGAPVAHEDHAVRAALAALGIQKAIRDPHADLPKTLTLRMGINTGLVVVGRIGDDLRMDYTAIGDTSNLAARLQQLAEPGTILVSESAHRLIEADAETTSLGPRQIKGKAEPQCVYRLDAARPGATRFDRVLRRGLAPFVGREPELAALERCWQQARAGSRRVVGVVGEAGLGKSRIIYELLHRLRESGTPILQGVCTPYGRTTPFLPFIEIVRGAFRLSAGDGPEEARRRLTRGLELLGLKADDASDYLLNLLGFDVGRAALRGLDGEIIGARTCEVLQELLRERCRLSPAVIFIDDLHWTDSASEDLLQRIIREEVAIPLLLVTAYRPEYRPPWAPQAGVEELRLQPLSAAACRQLIHYRLGADDIVSDLTRTVMEKAEGNPLFAEEIVSYLIDRGIASQSPGGVSADRSISAGELSNVPGSIRDVIMARVDRLPENHRILLQIAAVIGRSFQLDVLQTVSARNGAVQSCLQDLQRYDLVLQHAAGDAEEFRFKHALTQEAVYETLLGPRRAELHAKVGAAIEELYPGRLREWAEILAHHFNEARVTDKTIRYEALAGEKSLRVYAVDEAHRRFQRVADLIENAPGCVDDAFVADVLLAWARAHYYRKDLSGLLQLARYLPQVEALGEGHRLAMFLCWLGFGHVLAAEADAARPMLDRSIALGEALKDDECIGYACMGLGFMYQLKSFGASGDMARSFGQRGLALGERMGDVYLVSKCLVALATTALVKGRFTESRDFCLRAIELGRRTGDPRSTAMGLNHLALANIFDDQFEEAIEQAEESLRLSPDPLDRLMARAAKGVALALHGKGSEGVDMARTAIGEMEAGRARALMLWFGAPYGGALAAAGQLGAAVHHLENFIQRCSYWGNESALLSAHMVLGEIYLRITLGARVPFSVVMANLRFLLTAVPVATRRARHHLEEATRGAGLLGLDGMRARCLLGLGLLCHAKGGGGEARRFLDEATDLVSPLGAPNLVDKIEAARATFDR